MAFVQRKGPTGPPNDLSTQVPEQRVLGRDTGQGTGDAEPITVSQELDWAGTTTLWYFDGIDDYISVGDVAALGGEFNQPLTVSAWIRTTSEDPATVYVIAAKENSAGTGWAFFIDFDGHIFFHLFSAFPADGLSNRTGPGYNDGALHHVVAVYDGTAVPGGLLIYVDGELVATTNVTNTLSASIANAGQFIIGAGLDATTNFYGGTIEQVSVWSDALDASQVDDLNGNGTPPDLTQLDYFTANCIGYWQIGASDAVGADGIVDLSPLENDGTAQGGLAPGTSEGVMLVRSAGDWQFLAPLTPGTPLVSNGPDAEPSFQPLTLLPSPFKPAYFEDFLGGADATAGVASGIIGESGWSANFTGTAGTVARSDIAQKAESPGIYRVTSGAVNGDQQAIFWGLASGTDVIDSQSVEILEFLIYCQWGAGESQEIRVGMASDPLAASSGSDGVFFIFNDAVFPDEVQFDARAASANDIVGTGVSIRSGALTAFRLRIGYDQTTGKYTWLVQRAGSRALTGTHTGTAPSGFMNPFVMAVTQAGVPRLVDVDYCLLKPFTKTRGL